MKLKITHQTSYIYQSPLLYLLQVLHFQPMQTPWQNILYFQLKSKPNFYLKEMIDMHGNHTHLLNLIQPHASILEIKLDMQTIVETQNIARFDFKIMQDARLGEKNDKERINPIHYLKSGHLTQADENLKSFAKNFLSLKHAYLNLVQNIAKQGGGAIGNLYLSDLSSLSNLSIFENLLVDFAQAICQKIPYQSGATHSQTTAAEAFQLGAGVCQDHAHIALALLRVLDIPARYVSGYFYDPYHPNMASHAWVDVMLPIGFISLDVTHHAFTNDAYVRLAHGFDYQDISLIKGVREGGGTEQLTHHVQVVDFLACPDTISK